MAVEAPWAPIYVWASTLENRYRATVLTGRLSGVMRRDTATQPHFGNCDHLHYNGHFLLRNAFKIILKIL